MYGSQSFLKSIKDFFYILFNSIPLVNFFHENIGARFNLLNFTTIDIIFCHYQNQITYLICIHISGISKQYKVFIKFKVVYMRAFGIDYYFKVFPEFFDNREVPKQMLYSFAAFSLQKEHNPPWYLSHLETDRLVVKI